MYLLFLHLTSKGRSMFYQLLGGPFVGIISTYGLGFIETALPLTFYENVISRKRMGVFYESGICNFFLDRRRSRKGMF